MGEIFSDGTLYIRHKLMLLRFFSIGALRLNDNLFGLILIDFINNHTSKYNKKILPYKFKRVIYAVDWSTLL